MSFDISMPEGSIAFYLLLLPDYGKSACVFMKHIGQQTEEVNVTCVKSLAAVDQIGAPKNTYDEK